MPVSENLSNSDLKEMLQFFLSGGNISIEDVQTKIEDMKASKIIEEHIENYSNIWQGKNGRYYTHLPDQTGKDKRKLIAKSKKEDVEKAIVTYYRSLEEENSNKKITLKTLYPKWLEHKELHSNSTSGIRRINNEWCRYYLPDEIINTPLSKLTYVMLDEWAHKMVKEHKFTKTKYFNMSLIMRQALQYAVDCNILETNPFEKVKVNMKMYDPKSKPKDETQVFLIDEQPQIEMEAMKDFEENDNPASLAIAFAFQTGARMGEIVSLKWSDINEEKNNNIHIQRMEVREHKKLDNGKWIADGYSVVEHTKTNAGNRNTYLTSKALSILSKAKTWNIENGYGDSEYIFLNKDGTRIHGRALDTRIRKYCNHIGISEKSLHKIRKTYISTLLDSNNVNINTVRSLVGHEDERTTLGSYCFNRKSDLQTQADIEKALCI